jgi:hypothetical protein
MEWMKTGGGRLHEIIKLQREVLEEIQEGTGKMQMEP